MNTKPPTDWEAIEREYRAGQLSVVEIGRQYGVSHTAINKRAKKHGWTRNLAERVRQEVSARLVSAEVSPETARVAIETAAARGVEVVRQHRKDITDQRNLVRGLVVELSQQSDPDNQELLGDEIQKENDGRRRAAMLRAVALPARAGVMRDLAMAGKVLIELERQAFSLNEASSTDPTHVVERIERQIIDPADSDATGVSAASEASPL